MTLSALGVLAVYVGSGTKGPFSLTDANANPILFTDNSEIEVRRYDTPSSSYDSTLLSIGTDYTLTGAGLSTPGSVTLIANLASGSILAIRRVTPKTQNLDLSFGEDLSLDQLEASLDKITKLIQESREQTARSLRFSEIETDLVNGGATIVPEPVADTFLGWDGSGETLVNKTVITAVDAVFPASSSDNAIIRWDGTTGKTLQNSGVIVDDSNNMSGVANLTLSGALSQVRILDTGGDHYYTIVPGEDATANRTLTINLNDSDRTLNLPSPTFTNVTLTGYHELPEISTPSTPSSNTLLAYAKDDGNGITELYTLDSAGTEKKLSGVGKQTIWVPASSMTPATTNGPASSQLETSGNKVNYALLDFDATTEESAHFQIAMPKGWNEGTITYQVYWSSNGSDTDSVVWALQAVALSDGEARDVAFGTAVTVTDTLQSTANEIFASSESAALTIGSSPAEGDLCLFRFYRAAADGSDTMAEDGRLIGIKLFYTTNANTDD